MNNSRGQDGAEEGIDIEARVIEAVTNASTKCGLEQWQVKFCSYEIDV